MLSSAFDNFIIAWPYCYLSLWTIKLIEEHDIWESFRTAYNKLGFTVFAKILFWFPALFV